jgi:hypothetical protein
MLDGNVLAIRKTIGFIRLCFGVYRREASFSTFILISSMAALLRRVPLLLIDENLQNIGINACLI